MILAVEKLSKRLGGRHVLCDVSFQCGPEEAIALVGGNGAGKSTLIKIVAGILDPTSGGVTFGGERLTGNRWDLKRNIGYVPETSCPMPYLTVHELATMVAALRADAHIDEDLVDQLETRPFLHQRLSTLSQGQRRRACLLVALIGTPRLLLLDEPTNGLNPEGVATLVDILCKHTAAGGSVITATHDMAFATAIFAHVVKLAEGKRTS